MRSIVKGLADFCWFLFKWSLLAAVVAAVVAVPYMYRRLDSEIRRRVEATFAAHYPHLQVTVRSAELVQGEGIEVRGLVILDPAAQSPRAELVNLEEVFLHCKTDWRKLIHGRPDITCITVRRPTLRIVRQSDGTWSAARLVPLPKLSQRPPRIEVENGTIEILDATKQPGGMLTLRNISLTLAAPESASLGGAGGSARRLQGSLAGDHLRLARFEGVVDLDAPAWNIGGTAEGIEISPELRSALPRQWSDRLGELGALRGEGSVNFRVQNDPLGAWPCRFEASARLSQGRMHDPRLPHPLTDMRASMLLSNEGFAIDNMSARCGSTSLRFSCRRAGYSPGSPMSADAEIRQLDLEPQLYDCLPDALRTQWIKYLPSGQVHAAAKLAYDGQTWRCPEMFIQCLDVCFAYHKFPYRLEHAKGTLELKDDVLQVNLTASAGSQPVRISGKICRSAAGPSGWVEVKGDDLPVDERLLIALPKKNQDVIRALNPRGNVSFFARIWRDKPDEEPRRHIELHWSQGSIRFNGFPYPIDNVRGSAELNPDGRWVFRDLSGTNSTGFVTGEGQLVPGVEGGELSLDFRAENVPLDEELRQALRPNMQRLWSHLKPLGMVNLPRIEIRYFAAQKQLGLMAVVQPQPENTSIQPVAFPYRIEQLQGTFVYRDGHVALGRVTAEHGRVAMSASGCCDFAPDGSWNIHLEDAFVDRLVVDRDLVQALPGRLKKALSELNPTGPMHLSGSWDLHRGAEADAPLSSHWDLNVNVSQGTLDCGVKLANIFGGTRLIGQFDDDHFECTGELNIESLTYRGVQFTELRGPLWIDDQRALLGTWVQRRQQADSATQARESEQARPLTAKLFGGSAYADAWMEFGQTPRYGFRGQLVQADLSRCAREVVTGRQDVRGRMLASIDLHGTGRTINTLGGSGRIELEEADIYELPVMIAMLKILSIREPDSSAFSQSTIDYRIEGNHIYFDQIDFKGDAISLLGKGEMDFDRNVRLTFYPVVGRDEFQVPLINPLLKGASQQVMLIHVGGTLQQPETSKEAFPGVSQALQQLGIERAAPPGAPPPSRPAAGGNWLQEILRR